MVSAAAERAAVNGRRSRRQRRPSPYWPLRNSQLDATGRKLPIGYSITLVACTNTDCGSRLRPPRATRLRWCQRPSRVSHMTIDGNATINAENNTITRKNGSAALDTVPAFESARP